MEARRWIVASLGSLLLAGPGLAAAQDAPPQAPDEAQVEPEQRGWVSTFTAQALGGVQIFPGAASDFVGTGIAYGVLIGWKPFPIGGIELGYRGANYNAAGAAGGPQGSIFENGAQLLLRLSPRFGIVEPYLLAGGAFAEVTVRNAVGVKRDIEDDTILKVPLGLGVDVHLQPRTARPKDVHVVLGLRGSYELVFFDDFLPVSGRGADQIAISFLVGVGF